jgi:ABC-type sulfate/molybdate transport systems ATPase subunit
MICRCRRRLASGFELNADFRIPVDQSPVTVLFGPSGSGKTTLLRLIAGLDRADSGEISLKAAIGRAFLLKNAAPLFSSRTTRCFRICR